MQDSTLYDRIRLGVVVPSVNTVVEPWFSAACPARASVHAARMYLADALTPDNLVRMDREEGVVAIRQIMSCRPACVAYCCTASSIVQGLAYDRRLNDELTHAAGVPVFTATQAIIEALRVLGARSVCMASPYTDAIDRAEHDFFASAGFAVDGSDHLDIADAFRLAEPEPDAIRALVRRAWRPGSDAMLITCLNLRSHEVIEDIEAELGRPVVTSTQATFWKLLRTAGLREPVPGAGRLLAAH